MRQGRGPFTRQQWQRACHVASAFGQGCACVPRGRSIGQSREHVALVVGPRRQHGEEDSSRQHRVPQVAVGLDVVGGVDLGVVAGQLDKVVLVLVVAHEQAVVAHGQVLQLARAQDRLLRARELREAGVDGNFVMTGSGQLIEVQMSAEGSVFSRDQMNQLMDLAEKGTAELAEMQKAACA